MEREIKCVCGCSVFVEHLPVKINADEFKIWRIGEQLKKACYTVPIIKCVSCGLLYIPTSSFPGKNELDKEVKMYAELIENVKRYNSELINTQKNILNLTEKIAELEMKLSGSCACKEDADVKTTTRSGKTSKATIP